MRLVPNLKRANIVLDPLLFSVASRTRKSKKGALRNKKRVGTLILVVVDFCYLLEETLLCFDPLCFIFEYLTDSTFSRENKFLVSSVASTLKKKCN